MMKARTRRDARIVDQWDALNGMTVNGIELEVLRRGAGTPVLLLHGMDTVHPKAGFLDLLGRDAEIIAPSSPGFGNTQRPADFDTMYDLVHLYLAVLDELPYDKVALMGLSFGGWPRGGSRGRFVPPPEQADPGRPGRHQARRPDRPRHPRRLQRQPGRGAPPQLGTTRRRRPITMR